MLQDTGLQIPDIACRVYERAVRNCPWSAELWSDYLRAAERKGDSTHRVKGSCCTQPRDKVNAFHFCAITRDIGRMHTGCKAARKAKVLVVTTELCNVLSNV